MMKSPSERSAPATLPFRSKPRVLHAKAACQTTCKTSEK
jgi:hypothetical protein